MKIFGNIYTSLPLESIITQLVLPKWNIEEISHCEFSISGKGIHLSIEGSGEILVFGESLGEIELIDKWIDLISKLQISFSIDLHGDEARLLRRYQQ